jgi:signal transduction histidine kinase
VNRRNEAGGSPLNRATGRSPVLIRWPIRDKVLVGIALLAVIVAILSVTGAVGAYKYRSLVRSLELRAGELPVATRLGLQVSDLRVNLSESLNYRFRPDGDPQGARASFRAQREAVQQTFLQYRDELARNDRSTRRLDDSSQELEMAEAIAEKLDRIRRADSDEAWIFNQVEADKLVIELKQLQELCVKVPGILHQKIWDLRNTVKAEYRWLIGLLWGSTAAALLMFVLFIVLFYRWVFRPLRVLIKGSRVVAGGDFNYRIALATEDEMSELAAAMNDMTDRFQSIRDDLDHQVQIRTKQVVRSERLASVGFLAAGVAHEINNPLASIAMCAESLENRIRALLDPSNPKHEVVGNYLRMIQDNAFRCKDITERLLDFSRMGDVERQETDLRQLVQSVLEMVQTLGKYKNKQAVLAPGPPVLAQVNAQQLKQVVLNIVTNGLDSVESTGSVKVEVRPRGDQAELLFTDNGCGMTPEVLEHLFEPFFTRSRSGHGTGLGLSIVYSIVADHDGHIEATSQGAGRGSQFRVTLPLRAMTKKVARDEKDLDRRHAA